MLADAAEIVACDVFRYLMVCATFIEWTHTLRPMMVSDIEHKSGRKEGKKMEE